MLQLTFSVVHFAEATHTVYTHERSDIVLTRVLYSPGLCEWCIWRNGLSFANRHIFNKGHGWRVDIGTFKVIICTNSSLKVPVSTQKKEQQHLFNVIIDANI